MEERERFECELQDALTMLKGKIDRTIIYLDNRPEETERVAKLWCDTVKEFINYGVKKSECRKEENLFKKISRMFIFGR